MASPRQILTGLTLTIALLVAGFFSGVYFNQNRSTSLSVVSEKITSPTVLPGTIPTPAANTATYQASPPSKGRAYRTTTVSLDNNINGHTAIVYLRQEQAKGIAVDQSVLLYDKANLRLNIIGTVTNLAQGQGKFSDIVPVTIDIADTPEVPAKKVTTGEIITEELLAADRLPLSALQKNSDGTTFVWEAVTQPDGSMKAVKRPSKAIILNGNFFVLQNDTYVSNLYLLNPDASVQDGQTISVSRTLYQPPDVGNAQEIAMMRDDAITAYQKEVRQLPILNRIRAGSAGGCPTPPQITADFIRKVKDLAKDDADKARP